MSERQAFDLNREECIALCSAAATFLVLRGERTEKEREAEATLDGVGRKLADALGVDWENIKSSVRANMDVSQRRDRQ